MTASASIGGLAVYPGSEPTGPGTFTDLHVTGTSLLDGAVTMGSTLGVAGAVSLSSTLGVAGDVSITSPQNGNPKIGFSYNGPLFAMGGRTALGILQQWVTSIAGDALQLGDTTNVARLVLAGVAGVRVTGLGTGVVHSNGSGDLSSSLLVNADVSGTAAIAGSKITPTFGAQAISGTSSATFGSVRVTSLGVGIGHYDGSGNLTSSLLVNADVSASAAIAGSKLTPTFGSQALSTSGTAALGATTITGTLSVSSTITATNLTASQYVKTNASKILASQSGVPFTDLTGALAFSQRPASGTASDFFCGNGSWTVALKPTYTGDTSFTGFHTQAGGLYATSDITTDGNVLALTGAVQCGGVIASGGGSFGGQVSISTGGLFMGAGSIFVENANDAKNHFEIYNANGHSTTNATFTLATIGVFPSCVDDVEVMLVGIKSDASVSWRQTCNATFNVGSGGAVTEMGTNTLGTAKSFGTTTGAALAIDTSGGALRIRVTPPTAGGTFEWAAFTRIVNRAAIP